MYFVLCQLPKDLKKFSNRVDPKWSEWVVLTGPFREVTSTHPVFIVTAPDNLDNLSI
jgi:hypothetical protein